MMLKDIVVKFYQGAYHKCFTETREDSVLGRYCHYKLPTVCQRQPQS